MSRSVYSLVLSDEIVEATDRLAYERHLSRSGLIDRILAEYLACPTPAMRMKSVFDKVERLMEGVSDFQVQPQPSDAMLSLRSALHYRYRPTVRYVLELYPSGSAAGELRVSMRSQSRPLLDRLDAFFTAWRETEDGLVGSGFADGRVECEIGDGRYSRLLPASPALAGEEDLARAACRYIRLMDHCLKQWFAEEDPRRARRNMEEAYRTHLEKEPTL